MQEMLTNLAVAIELSILFLPLIYAVERVVKREKVEVSEPVEVPAEDIPQVIEEMIDRTMPAVIREESVTVKPTAAELRKMCEKAGIKWRHAHGRDRHLTKGEMLELLAHY